LVLDYFQTSAFLGTSKETSLRGVLPATSLGISRSTTSRSEGRIRFNHYWPSARRQSWRSGRPAGRNRANQCRTKYSV